MHDHFTPEDEDDLIGFATNAADDGHRLQIDDGPDGSWILSIVWKPPTLRAVEEMDPDHRKELRELLGVREGSTVTTRILRRPEVEKRVGLARSRIYELLEQGAFPKPVKLAGGRAVGWVEDEIEDWLQAQIQARDGEG